MSSLDLLVNFLGLFKDWPWLTGDPLLANTLTIFILAFVWLHMTGFAEDKSRKEKELQLPEVPQEIAIVTLSKNGTWMRAYHWYWESYPRDICTYVRRSVCVIVGLFISAALVFSFLVFFGSLIAWLLYGVLGAAWFFILLLSRIPDVAVGVASGIWHFILALPRLFMEVSISALQGISHAVFSPITYFVLAAGALIVLSMFVFKFFYSQTWQITKLWIRSKREKYCLPIRVI